MGSWEILKNGNTTVCLCDDGNDWVGTKADDAREEG